jgi:hypothetical protein
MRKPEVRKEAPKKKKKSVPASMHDSPLPALIGMALWYIFWFGVASP